MEKSVSIDIKPKDNSCLNKKKKNKVRINTTNISPLRFINSDIFMFDCRFPQKVLQKIPNKNSLKLNKDEIDFLQGLVEENFLGVYNANSYSSNFVGILPRFKTYLSNNFTLKLPHNELYSKIDEILKLNSQKGHVSLMKLKELLRNEIGKN